MPDGSINYAAMEAALLRWMASGGGGFEEWSLRVFDFQRSHNPTYARFCDRFPPPSTWREIPAVPVSAFKTSDLASFPPEKVVRTFRTSGTTGGTPGRHHFCSLALYLQAAVRGWHAAGLPACGVVSLIPPAEANPESSLSQMASWLVPRPHFFFNRREELAQHLETGGSFVIFGTALAFLDFFEWLGSRSLRLGPGSLAVETGGYKGTRRGMPKGELYELFQARLGLRADDVWSEYGMTELSSQFYTHGVGRPHQAPPWARGLVVDPVSGLEVRDGEKGILKLFDCANLGSVLALQTSDLAIRRGDSFELIGRDPSALPRGCSIAADEMLA